MKYFSLFSGIGGFELGIGDKHECAGYSEIDEYAVQIYQKYFPNHKNYGDITAIVADQLPDFDLLVGGFPCPTFSSAGKRAGFNDPRGQLIFDVIRIIKAKKPSYFILENVRGLLNHEGGETFKTIVNELGNCGYVVQWLLLDSQNFGVAQQRKRIFIVGNLRTVSTPSFQSFGEGHKRNGTEKRPMEQRGLCLTTRTGARQDPSAETFIGHTLKTQANTYSNGYAETFIGYCPTTKDRGVGQAGNETHVARIDPIGKGTHARFPRRVDRLRGKALGNAVTVNVIKALVEKL